MLAKMRILESQTPQVFYTPRVAAHSLNILTIGVVIAALFSSCEKSRFIVLVGLYLST